MSVVVFNSAKTGESKYIELESEYFTMDKAAELLNVSIIEVVKTPMLLDATYNREENTFLGILIDEAGLWKKEIVYNELASQVYPPGIAGDVIFVKILNNPWTGYSIAPFEDKEEAKEWLDKLYKYLEVHKGWKKKNSIF